jgi:hypothetical protein
MELLPLDVVWIDDETTIPPKLKMVVCIDPEKGWFFRINTKRWPIAVPLLAAENEWLRHDSFLECGEPLEIDSYVISKGRVIGAVCSAAIPLIAAAIKSCPTLSSADMRRMIECIGCKPN